MADKLDEFTIIRGHLGGRRFHHQDLSSFPSLRTRMWVGGCSSGTLHVQNSCSSEFSVRDLSFHTIQHRLLLMEAGFIAN
uniref:Uncharacterized protein n=1 Tax=Arundo donax TaxID=35708 RepID=A0A0A8XZQ8_ARUDO